jgi:hypothetical protein
MSDRQPGEGDELPPPYRPWQASGVAQPGADRPSSAPEPTRRGRVAPPPVPPAYPVCEPAPAQWYAPDDARSVRSPTSPGTALPAARPASTRPVPPRRYRGGAVDRSVFTPLLALLILGTTWLPWLKSPLASVFNLNGSGFERTANAWDLPARAIWSYRTPRGGPSLGWVVLGLAVALLVTGLAQARTAARLLAALEALVAVLYLVQLGRLVNDTPSFGNADFGVTDLAGLGVYLLVALGLVAAIVRRD